jgi:hypothetical protein
MTSATDLPPDPFGTGQPPSISALPHIEHVDMASLLSEPERPIPYLIDQFAARGNVTALAGQAGIGKSFLALALGAAVAAGKPAADIPTEKTPVMYLDAENGPRLMARRWRATGTPADAIDLRDVRSLDIALDGHRRHLTELIAGSGAGLVILDALKRLSPSADESSNDAMLPVMSGLNEIARDTDAAIVLLHHRSVKPDAPAFRGASVLIDQAQMFFGLAGTLRQLELIPLKFRLDETPPTRALGFGLDADGILRLETRSAGGPRASDLEKRVHALVADADAIRVAGGIDRETIASRFGMASSRSGSVDHVLKRLLAIGWTEEREGRCKQFLPPSP